MSIWTVEWLQNYFACPLGDIPLAAQGRDLVLFLQLYGDQNAGRRVDLHNDALLTNLVGTRLVGNFVRSPFQDSMDQAMGLPSDNERSRRSLPDLVSRLLLTSDQVVVEDPLLHVKATGCHEGRVLHALEEISLAAPLLMRGDVTLSPLSSPLNRSVSAELAGALSDWEDFGDAWTPVGRVQTAFPEFPYAYAGQAIRSRALEQLELMFTVYGPGWRDVLPVWTLPTEREQRAFLGLLELLAGFSAASHSAHIGRPERHATLLCSIPLPDPSGVSAITLSRARHSDVWIEFRETLRSALDALLHDLDDAVSISSPRAVEDFRRHLSTRAPSLEVGTAPFLGAAIAATVQFGIGTLDSEPASVDLLSLIWVALGAAGTSAVQFLQHYRRDKYTGALFTEITNR